MKKAFTNSILNRGYWVLGLMAITQFNVSGQTSHAVAVTQNVFTPAEITIKAGDTVVWTNSDGTHNVNGLKTKFASNPESFGNNVGSDWTFSHVFTITGTYNYQCDPHGAFGMTGKVMVEELPPDTLTVNFSGMNPHVGQTLWFSVIEKSAGTELIRMNRLGEVSYSIVVPGIKKGMSYNIDFFTDHNGNGSYDAPPSDHAWRLELNDASGNETIDFSHNTNFTDIEWKHRATVNLTGMAAHVGQEINFALINVESGEIIERKSELGMESFTVELGELIPGNAYYVDFFSDYNENGHYDAPPNDHAWRLEIPNSVGDSVFDFDHNANFVDIMWKHRLKVNFTGMTPHVGQMFTVFVRDKSSGNYLDTVKLAQITSADFDLSSWVIKPGQNYVLDIHADHNENSTYDAPPTDHAWRMDVGDVMGDVTLNFIHNTSFTDILLPLGPHIMLTEDDVLGSILTDADGNTLYIFAKDAVTETSLCVGGCVGTWPLFYFENPELGEGLDENDFSSIVHPEGGKQTTYKGWPLYYFKNDQNPGETNGEAVGSVWFVAKPDYSIMLLNSSLLGKDGVSYNSSYEPGEEVVEFFVDQYGKTLYTWINDGYNQNNFTKDDFSNNPSWPVFEKELQSLPSTLDTTLFGSIDVFGHQQITYKGWPIYYFGADSLKGNTMGVSVPSPGIWPVAVQNMDEPAATTVEKINPESEFQLYPNPATEMLNIVSDNPIESITIFSLTGSRILSIQNIESTHHVMFLGGIDPGVYLLEIMSSDKRKEVSRLIKR